LTLLTIKIKLLFENIQNGINGLISSIHNSKKILIITHYNPDGDAIGSSMGLYHFLKKSHQEVTLMVPNDFPAFLTWMKDSSEIIVFQHQQKKAIEIIEQADLIICVDFNEFKRLKDMGPRLEEAKAVKALIDHHPLAENSFAHIVHDTTAAASAELIYKFIVGSGNQQALDKTIAECIYTGIMTDTGNFSHNSSNPNTFKIVADLLSLKFNKDDVYNNVFNNFSHNRMRLMGYCLSEKMVVLPHLKAAYIWLTAEELEKYNFQQGDTEGFVNMPFSIKGIRVTALFSEKKDAIRISFRSKGNFSVNDLCKNHFEGGGHRNAAGGESKLPMVETILKFEKLLETYSKDIF
jgi:phosphoesterase RecJ-like protein